MGGTRGARFASRFLTAGAAAAVGLAGLVAAAPPAAAAVTCGMTVTTNLVLDADLQCPGDGLLIGADGITIDLNGHTIQGPGSSVPGSGIVARDRQAFVWNGTIQGFATGIRNQGSTTHHGVAVSMISFNNNGTGVYNLHVGPLFVSESSFSGNGTAIYCAEAGGKDLYQASTFTNNHMGVGFGKCGADVSANRFTGNGTAIDGVYAIGSNITGNDIATSTVAGIALRGISRLNSIQRNSIHDNRVGIAAESYDRRAGFSQNTIAGNTLLRNAAAGLCIVGTQSAPDNVVSENFVSANGSQPGFCSTYNPSAVVNDGIYVNVGLAPGTTLRKNAVTSNADYGIEGLVGTIDGGGNIGIGNGNPAQCLGVSCPSPKPPGPPTNVRAFAGNASGQVTWSPPASEGASVTGYTVTVSPGGATQDVPATARSATFDALINGTSYTFTVVAHNTVGNSSPVASNTVTPAAVPGPPTNVVASAGDHSATVSWLPPSNDGGSSVDGYAVTLSPGGQSVNVGAGERSASFTGLTNDVLYTLSVQAHNATGFGIPGESNLVIPAAPIPDLPEPPVVEVKPEVAVRSGYWMLDAAGHVYSFGDARYFGGAANAMGPAVFGVAAVHLEPTPSGGGYWIVDTLGRVYAFGDAGWYGNADRAQVAAGELVSSLSATPSGHGYWIFTSRGRVIPCGDAQAFGDVAAMHLNGPVLGSIATPSGRGYYMVASDGGIFAFGDAAFRGSMGGTRLNAPVQSLVPTASGNGYWLVASDGGIFAFGDAVFRGSMGSTHLNAPVVGMVRYGNGYLMVGADGGIFSFSDQPFRGSLGNNPPANRITSVATLAG
ncbi:MAG: fibronectin type III domain-containing protein [Acidimicrobiia bacterium]